MSISMAQSIPVVDALQVLIDHRQERDIVITNQGSARVWPQLARQPLDFHYNPSTMGGALPLALGLALAQHDRHVMCVSGDGALLMSLGSLVTTASAGPRNLTIVVLDNGLYEVTGGQKTAATNVLIDWPTLARAAGFPSAQSFDELSAWKAGAAEVLAKAGPRFISLVVRPTPIAYLHAATPPITEQVASLRGALGTL
jgi:sulfopyruvate decarboxylase subunit beta